MIPEHQHPPEESEEDEAVDANSHDLRGTNRCTMHHHGLDTCLGTKAHPALSVLVCDAHAGNLPAEKFASDGYKLHCQWCHEPRDETDETTDVAQFSLCTSCRSIVCKKCLVYNFGKSEAQRIICMDDWECYLCNPTPQLLALQQLCSKQLEGDLSELEGSQPPLFASTMMNEGINLLQKLLTEATAATDKGLTIKGITPFEVGWSGCVPPRRWLSRSTWPACA